jgi:hypothetical protein
MDEATEILVIITSSVLILFLLLGILAAIQFLLLLKKVKKLVQKAENVTVTVEVIGDTFRKASTTVGIGSIISNIANSFSKASNSKRRK